MNRHERRRTFAAGVRAAKAGKVPAEYEQVIAAIVRTYRAGVHSAPTDEKPRFAMPPAGVIVAVSLDHLRLERIAKNDPAFYFLTGIIDGAKRTGDMRKMPTLFMLNIALLELGDAVIIEELSLAELGFARGERSN
jgi:hypothetical protein